MKSKQIINLVFYYIIPLLLLVLALVLFSSRKEFHNFMKLTGIISTLLFIVLMYVKPVWRILPKAKIIRKIIPYRRQIAVLMFYFAAIHSIGLLIFFKYFNIPDFVALLHWNNYLFYGLISFAIMIPLWATSNDISLKYLGRKWKKFQYLSYVAFIFTLIHAGMFSNNWLYYAVAIIYIILKIIEFLKRR